MTLRKYVSRSMVPVMLVLLTIGANPALAAVADYVGFGWETGGIDPSVPGDELAIATVVTQIDALFGIDLNAVESTLYIDGLLSQGAIVNPSTGITTISYTGGTLRLYADPGEDSDWGINPANGTVPSTFINGDLLFEASFTSFSLILQSSGGGAFEGYLNGTGGSALIGPCSDCAYTFAGAFSTPSGAQIPEGYDLQVDGVLEVESAVAIENMSWGSVKNLYR
ncbi:MAG: hypothetical protein ABFS42_04595 [Candidatus Krumholzibacteriota bacterium]